MKRSQKFLILCVALIFIQCSTEKTNSSKKLIDWVNPFIGTGGHGHTFPGATAPFGMVQLSPDTRLEGWDGCSGYHYTDTIIYGFSHTHLSGTGISDYGDILVMPTVGKIYLNNGSEKGVNQGYASRFDKSSEAASPGFYKVKLKDYDIDVALSTTTRAGFHKYNFNSSNTGNLIVDVLHRDKLEDGAINVDQIENGIISGYRISHAWTNDQRVYFYMYLSQAPKLAATEKLGENIIKAGLSFEEIEHTELLVKVGISPVSIENAKANLESEIPNWDFNQTRQQTESIWENELNKIVVKGGTDDQKSNFYTALYHSMIAPNTWSDVNHEYLGMDRKVHKVTNGKRQYTVFSLWDTFRATHPLYTIIQQKRTNEFMQTFLNQYEQGGRLPVWELAGKETECMIGYHSVSAATDAFVKGLDDWDTELMLKAMVKGADLNHFGLESYHKNGCVLAADEAESVSKTLEYAYDDWCIAQFAKKLANDSIYNRFIQRAQNYKNLFDPSTGFFRGRVDGGWFSPFDPAEVNFNYTEANAWQYSMFVPQDINGLIQLMGGAENFERHLDNVFQTSSKTTGRDQADITGLIGQYAHGNEPSHHMAYLYNCIGKPWKTQQRVREILNNLYTNQPDGLSGNEDCGQMSAWYVLSAMGIYPITPGSPNYAIGSPLFDQVTLNLENGKSFIIKASGNGSEKFIQTAQLNGQPYTKSFINHADIMAGGTLNFELSDEVSTSWGTKEGDYDATKITDNSIVPTPYLLTTTNTFTEDLWVEMGSVCSSCDIWFSMDKGKPELYNAKFGVKLDKTTKMTVWAENKDGVRGHSIKQQFHKIKGGRSIKLNVSYANQYSAGGNNALIDYQRGANNYRTGRWQGYQGQKFEAIVDLGRYERPKYIKIGFLQDIKSWIFYPKQVRFYTSYNNRDFELVESIDNEFADNVEGCFTQDFAFRNNRDIRYIKIEADNYGPCPEWHLGAGGKTWLFADEIIIE